MRWGDAIGVGMAAPSVGHIPDKLHRDDLLPATAGARVQGQPDFLHVVIGGRQADAEPDGVIGQAVLPVRVYALTLARVTYLAIDHAHRPLIRTLDDDIQEYGLVQTQARLDTGLSDDRRRGEVSSVQLAATVIGVCQLPVNI